MAWVNQGVLWRTTLLLLGASWTLAQSERPDNSYDANEDWNIILCFLFAMSAILMGATNSTV